jgi:hypothetical protein
MKYDTQRKAGAKGIQDRLLDFICNNEHTVPNPIHYRVQSIPPINSKNNELQQHINQVQ